MYLLTVVADVDADDHMTTWPQKRSGTAKQHFSLKLRNARGANTVGVAST